MNKLFCPNCYHNGNSNGITEHKIMKNKPKKGHCICLQCGEKNGVTLKEAIKTGN